MSWSRTTCRNSAVLSLLHRHGHYYQKHLSSHHKLSPLLHGWWSTLEQTNLFVDKIKNAPDLILPLPPPGFVETTQQFMAFCGVIFSEAAVCQILNPASTDYLLCFSSSNRSEEMKLETIWSLCYIVSPINAKVFLLLSYIFRGKPFLKVASKTTHVRAPAYTMYSHQRHLLQCWCRKNEHISLLNAVTVIEKFSEPKSK